MEEIFEVILELIFDGVFDAAASRRVPLPLRILCALIVTAAFGAVILLLIIGGIRCLHSDELTNGVVPAVLLFAAAAGFFAALILRVAKYYKSR